MTTRDEMPALTPVLVRMLEGRVGSTAMVQLLATSPAVALDRVYPFQNSYLTYFARLTGQISRPNPTEKSVVEFIYGSDGHVMPLPFHAGIIDPVQMTQRSLSAIWQEFSRSVTERSAVDVRFYAEKYWGDIATVLDAGLRPVVIDLVRDPRDIIASIRAFNQRHSQRFFGRPAATDDWEHLRHLVMGMALRFREFRAALPVPVLQVRYEDFVTDMPAHAAKLESLLGTNLDVGAVTSNHGLMEKHMTATTVEASIGRWRSELSAKEVSFIQGRLAAGMLEFGYT